MTVPLCFNRSAAELLRIVHDLDVEKAERYRKRDVTGDGVSETFCNIYVRDFTERLGCPIPEKLAKEQLVWLDSPDGRLAGWEECSAEKAVHRAEAGFPTIAGWLNPNPHGHSHIAMVVPASGEAGLHISQAGRTNLSNARIGAGFGVYVARFFTRD